MREDDTNWFSKWEEQLPSQEELMPLSQTLITPNLATVFDIQNPSQIALFHHQQSSSSAEFAGGGIRDGDVSGSEEPARTLKRPRLVWTPQLHKRFVDVVAHLGIKNAVPKTIMQLMSVDGLTRENVASHLQKYRLYLKRMQGVSNTGAGSGDPVTDRLFASSPVPAHFLYPQVGTVAVVSSHHGNGQYSHQRLIGMGMGQFGLVAQNSGQFDHLLLSRQAQLGGPIRNGMLQGNYGFVEDMGFGSVADNDSKKILTLFPTSDE